MKREEGREEGEKYRKTSGREKERWRRERDSHNGGRGEEEKETEEEECPVLFPLTHIETQYTQFLN